MFVIQNNKQYLYIQLGMCNGSSVDAKGHSKEATSSLLAGITPRTGRPHDLRSKAGRKLVENIPDENVPTSASVSAAFFGQFRTLYLSMQMMQFDSIGCWMYY